MSVFNKYREFEQYFEKELKTTPQDFIVMKYKAGSSPNAVQYLYEIVSAEIGKKNRVQVAPFEYYYKQLLKNGLIQLGYKAANQEKVLDNSAIKVCRRELLPMIGDVSFGKFFYNELDGLFQNKEFMDGIIIISQKNKAVEFEENPQSADFLDFKRRILPQMLTELNLDRISEFIFICQETRKHGYAETSAKITVYYLARMMYLFGVAEAQRNVKSLSKAIKEQEQ